MLSVDVQKQEILERFHRIARMLTSIRDHDESLAAGPLDLLETAEELLKRASLSFIAKWSERLEVPAKNGEQQIELGFLCSEYQGVLRQFEGEILPTLDGGESHYIPFELEPHLRLLVDEISAPSDSWKTVLYSSHRHNYSIGQYDTAQFDLLDEAKGTKERKRYLRFAIPRIARDSLHLHAILLGHEVGHLLEWTSPVSSTRSYTPDFNADEIDESYRLPAIDLVGQNAHGWLQEIVADIYSVLLLGPASILSLAEIATTVSSSASDTASHPGTDRRLDVMLLVLRRQGFLEEDLIRLDSLVELNELSASYNGCFAGRVLDNRPTRTLPFSPLYFVWTYFKSELTSLIDDCVRIFPRQLMYGTDRWSSVLRIANALADGRPSGQILRQGRWYPTDARDLVNAAWIVKLNHLPKLATQAGISNDGVGLVQASHILEGLLLKSLEIANHVREYR